MKKMKSKGISILVVCLFMISMLWCGEVRAVENTVMIDKSNVPYDFGLVREGVTVTLTVIYPVSANTRFVRDKYFIEHYDDADVFKVGDSGNYGSKVIGWTVERAAEGEKYYNREGELLDCLYYVKLTIEVTAPKVPCKQIGNLQNLYMRCVGDKLSGSCGIDIDATANGMDVKIYKVMWSITPYHSHMEMEDAVHEAPDYTRDVLETPADISISPWGE